MNFYKILVPIILGFSVVFVYANHCQPACHTVGDIVGSNKVVGVQTIDQNNTEVFLMPTNITQSSNSTATTNLLTTAQSLSGMVVRRSTASVSNTVNCVLLNKKTGEIGCKVTYTPK